MKKFKNLLTILILIYSIACNAGTNSDLYDVKTLISNKYSNPSSYNALIKVSPKKNKSLLLKDENHNNIPYIDWVFSKQAEILKFDVLQGEDKSLVIPLNVQIKKGFTSAVLEGELNFVICGKECRQVQHKLELPLDLYQINKKVQEEIDDALYDDAKQGGHFWFLLLALVGGFILNFMPCVLPVLSLKIFSVLKNSGKGEDFVRKSFMSTSFGIIATFIFLGIFFAAMRSFGDFIGLGIHFQNPFFIVVMILILMMLAAVVKGEMNIPLPLFLSGTFDYESKANKPFFGSFLNGVVATMLATPCTAPIIGSALTFSLTHSGLYMIVMFGVIGLGMASPYLLMAHNRSVIKFLPKPGAWMEYFKKFFEVMIYLTIMWLIYIIAGIIDRNSAIILFLIIMLFKFVLTKDNGLLSNKFIKIGLLVIVTASAFYLPYKNNVNDEIRSEEVDNFWQSFSVDKIEKLLKQDKIVFVDITADWCVTCKYNKFMVLNNEYVMDFLKKNGVIALRGNFTKNNKEISEFLSKHNRFGIPFNIIYSKKHPKGYVLPEILTTKLVIDAIRSSK
jgi:suppressor for copper-sensitivity B